MPRVFSELMGLTHPDYPPLHPAMITRAWKYAGRETVLVPMAQAMIYTFGIVGLASSALAKLRMGDINA